jgi:hypothetical protein
VSVLTGEHLIASAVLHALESYTSASTTARNADRALDLAFAGEPGLNTPDGEAPPGAWDAWQEHVLTPALVANREAGIAKQNALDALGAALDQHIVATEQYEKERTL